MDFFKNLLGQVLNPRSRLERLYRSEPQAGTGAGDSVPMFTRGRLRPRHIVLNFPLMIGTVLVIGLFLLAVFGPLWAPRNPYIASEHIVPHYDFQQDEYVQPPLPPSAEYPLGTDRWGCRPHPVSFSRIIESFTA